VVTGFTAGIAVSIFVSQLKEVLGLDVAMPGDFIEKMAVLGEHIGETRPATVALTVVSVGLILALRRFRPRWPGFLIAVVLASVAVLLADVDVATIGSRFGGVPSTLPAPSLPSFDFALVQAVMPDALTIALLAGIESLLSAVVADGMTGRRHRSNCELVAQGVANIASVLFGGLSATGAIARTATNIRSGARTPVAGIMHAVFLLLFMAVAAPVLSYVPLAALAAILLIVAWNISEVHHIKRIMTTASRGDRVVLAGTFFLTVVIDLTVGIAFGVVAAAILFMHRMAEAVEVETHDVLIDRDQGDDLGKADPNAGTPDDVVVYRINGPFFFGAAERVSSVLDRIASPPRAFVLDFSSVPFIDSTAGVSLVSFVDRARGHGSKVVLSGARAHVRADLARLGIDHDGTTVEMAPDLGTALARLSRERSAGA
jgi:SulP family sulfate permease